MPLADLLGGLHLILNNTPKFDLNSAIFLERKFSFVCLAQTYRKCIQNPIKHLWWNVLQNKETFFPETFRQSIYTEQIFFYVYEIWVRMYYLCNDKSDRDQLDQDM